MTGVLPEALKFSEPPTSPEYRRALLGMRCYLAQRAGFDSHALQRRIEALMHIARLDLGLARLAEGHLDALSILAEAAMEPQPGALYAVWASGGPMDTTQLSTSETKTLSGAKPFCSGAGLADRALIWVSAARQLVDVNLVSQAAKLRWEDDNWRVSALATVQTWTGVFDGVPVDPVIADGRADWYFERPGFWLGALCPAACWAGGAQGLLDYALNAARDNPIAQVHTGRMLAAAFGMESALRAAAAQLPGNIAPIRTAQARALAARHITERSCAQIIDEFSRMLGPRPLVNEPAVARRIQELQIYQRQCHGDRDLAELAAAVTGDD